MARGRKKETVKKRDDKGRILPTGISQRKDGRYIWRYTYNGVSYGPKYSWDLGEIKRYAVEQSALIAKGACPQPDKTTLNEYFYYWMEQYRRGDIREQSYQNNLNYWSWYVKDTLGKKKLQQIKSRDLVAHFNYLQTRKEKSVTHDTALRVCGMVNAVFKCAVKEEILIRNPAENVAEDIKKINVGEEKVALTPDQQRKFMDYIKNHRFYKWHYQLFVFLFGSGCRVGEACALCWDDVDFDQGRVEIYKTLHYRNWGDGKQRVRLIGTTKTQNSVRSLPMLPVVKANLETQYVKVKSSKFKKCKVKSIHSSKDVVPLAEFYDDFVFVNQDGEPYTPDYVTQIIKKIVASYNRDEQREAEKRKKKPRLLDSFSSHYTRHTFATRCREMGLATENISYWLGHASREGGSTTGRYIHVDTWDIIKGDVEVLKEMQVAS